MPSIQCPTVVVAVSVSVMRCFLPRWTSPWWWRREPSGWVVGICGEPAAGLPAVDETGGDVDGGGDVAVGRVEQGAPDDEAADAGQGQGVGPLGVRLRAVAAGSPPSSSVGSVVAAITRSMSSTTGILSQL